MAVSSCYQPSSGHRVLFWAAKLYISAGPRLIYVVCMHDDNQTLGWLLVLCLNSNLIPGISAAAVMTPDWLLAVSLFTTRVLVPVPSTRAPCGSGPPPRSTIFYTQQCKESFQFMKLLVTLLTFITLHSEYMNQYANNRAIPIWKQCMSWSRMWRY